MFSRRLAFNGWQQIEALIDTQFGQCSLLFLEIAPGPGIRGWVHSQDSSRDADLIGLDEQASGPFGSLYARHW